MARRVVTRLEYERRFRLRLSQVEMARLAQVQQSDVSGAENLQARPSVWRSLSSVLRLTPEELMGPPLAADIAEIENEQRAARRTAAAAVDAQ